MSFQRSLYKWIPIITALVAIITGPSFRPNVDYSLDLVGGIGDEYYYEMNDLNFDAIIENRGQVNAPLFIIITLQNASFTELKGKYLLENEGKLLKFPTIAKINEGEMSFSISVQPEREVDFFSISMNVERRRTNDLMLFLLNMFYNPTAWHPNYVEYQKITPQAFERVS